MSAEQVNDDPSEEIREGLPSDLQTAWQEALEQRALGPIAKKIKIILVKKPQTKELTEVQLAADALHKSDLSKIQRAGARVAQKIQDLLGGFLVENGICNEGNVPSRTKVIRELLQIFENLED